LRRLEERRGTKLSQKRKMIKQSDRHMVENLWKWKERIFDRRELTQR